MKFNIMKKIFPALVFLVFVLSACDNSPDKKSVYEVNDLSLLYDNVKTVPAGISSVGIWSADNASGIPAFATDANIGTGFLPGLSETVTYNLSENKILNRIKIFGKCDYKITVSGVEEGSRFSIVEMDGSSLNENMWNSISISGSSGYSVLEMHLEPLTAVPERSLKEIEFWYEGSRDIDYGFYSLNNIRSSSDLEMFLTGNLDYIRKYPAFVEETLYPGNPSLNLNRAEIFLEADPGSVKNAVIVYEAKGIETQQDLILAVNGTSAQKNISRNPDSVTGNYQLYYEAINPEWLVRGKNTVTFTSSLNNPSVKNVCILAETDNGWNVISPADGSEIFDSYVDTSVYITPQFNTVNIDFEKKYNVESVFFFSTSASGAGLSLQKLDSTGWSEVSRLNENDIKSGWNRIDLQQGEDTASLRFVLDIQTSTKDANIRISEVRAVTSSSDSVFNEPEIYVTFPQKGEYFGRTALIKGFVKKNGNEVDKVKIGNADSISLDADGMFSYAAVKDAHGFAAQSDDDMWSLGISAEYNGNYISEIVNLYNNIDSTVDDDASDDDDNPGTVSDEDLISQRGYKTTVYPQTAKTITFGDVTIEFPAGAVKEKKEIIIVPLYASELPGLDEGMTNVTAVYAGYRFLPHGSFEKPVKIHFKYAPEKLSSDQKDDSVFMYYYNEDDKVWKKLERVSLDKPEALVTSLTDHFTDIINATLTVPEHPGTLTYNPNSIKDIKAGDPASRVNFIKPPQASNTGDASVQYPIEIPGGRMGMQPSLSLNYNSGGSSGWAGYGWSIPVRAVTFDTKWGVPRYDDNDRFLLDGQPIVRKSDGKYVLRTEGSFSIIERLTDSNGKTYWQVRDKNGILSVYGQSDGARIYNPYRNNKVSMWCLEKVIDLHGNNVMYDYFHDNKSVTADSRFAGGDDWENVYLQEISYTGKDSSKGNYRIKFDLAEGSRRDPVMSARTGMKILDKRLLKTISVNYGSQFIRSYDFIYEEGVFNKTLLKKIVQNGENGSEFNYYEFDYAGQDIKNGNDLNLFSGKSIIDKASDFGIKLLGFLPYIKFGSIEGSTSRGGGMNGYFGLAPGSWDKRMSVGGTIGGNTSSSSQNTILTDIDADGLQDIVLIKSGDIYYKKNRGNGNFSDDIKLDMEGISSNPGVINESNTKTLTYGGQAHAVISSVNYQKSSSTTYGKSYLSDINGDGRVDIVKNGTVYFNITSPDLNDGNATFSNNSISAGVVFNTGTGVDMTGIKEEISTEEREIILKENYLDDPVRIWEAPFSGKVMLRGKISLISPSSTAGNVNLDGINYMIQFSDYSGTYANPVLLQGSISRTDIYPVEYNEIVLDVTKGDKFYFRVNSMNEGSGDIVKWNSDIFYVEETGTGFSGSVSGTDYDYLSLNSNDFDCDAEGFPLNENGERLFFYNSRYDFSHAGSKNMWIATVEGDADFNAVISKDILSDDVKLIAEVYSNISNDGSKISYPLIPQRIVNIADFAWDDTVSEQNLTHAIDNLKENDQVRFYLISDTRVNWNKININANLTYNRLANGGDVEYTDTDENVRPLYSYKIAVNKTINLPTKYNSAENFPFVAEESALSEIKWSANIGASNSKTLHYRVLQLQQDNTYKPVTIDQIYLKQYVTVKPEDQFYVTLAMKQMNRKISKVCEQIITPDQSFYGSNRYFVASSRNKSFNTDAELRNYISSISNNLYYTVINSDNETVYVKFTNLSDLLYISDYSADYNFDVVFDETVNLNENEKYYFEMSSSESETEDVVYFKDLLQISNVSIKSPDEEPVSYSNFYVTAKNFWGEFYPFAGGYRNWYYGRVNGNSFPALIDTNEIYKMEETLQDYSDQLEKHPSNQESIINDMTEYLKKYMFCYYAKSESDDIKALKIVDADNPDAVYYDDVWMGNDSMSWLNSCYMSSTRVNMKYVPDSGNSGSSAGFSASNRGITKRTVTKSTSVGGGASVPVGGGLAGGSATWSDGNAKCELDMQDFNGDRYPDIIKKNSIQYTNSDGDLTGSVNVSGHDYVRENKDTNFSYSMSASANVEVDNTLVNGSGTVSGRTISAAGSYSAGETETKVDYIDVNGDGLPDKLFTESGSVNVQYNYGYSFSSSEKYTDISDIRKNFTSNIPLPNMIYGFASQVVSILKNSNKAVEKSKGAYEGGASIKLSQCSVETLYMDINGDGFPDRVTKELELDSLLGIVVKSQKGRVYLNSGYGLNDNSYGFDTDSDKPLFHNFDITASVGGSIPFYIPINILGATVCTIVINPGADLYYTIGSGLSEMNDMNGDGLADMVEMELYDDHNVEVSYNRSGGANLLTKVKSSFGNWFSIEYGRAGNTQKMPQSQYVMKKVTASNGMEKLDAETGNRFTTEITYEDGYYDKCERDFFGFGKVTEKNDLGQSVVREFINNDYFRKGIEKRSVSYDENKNELSITEVKVGDSPVEIVAKDANVPASGSYFPSVSEKITTVFDNGGSITTNEKFEYDKYGNVTTYVLNDDVTAVIKYHSNTNANLVALPTLITVTDSNGTVLRKREGIYTSKGQVMTVIQHAGNSQKSETDIAYNGYGNISVVRYPKNLNGQNYSVSYIYDSETNTYITGTRDSFGYISTASYDLMYGVPLNTRDINGTVLTYIYDSYGRLSSVYGPYDGGNSVASLRVNYNPPVIDGDGFISSPAKAVVMNKVFRDSSDTLDTVTYVDGFGGVIQTSKESQVNGSYGYVVSGRVIKDVLGRPVQQGEPEFRAGNSGAFAFATVVGAKSTKITYDTRGRQLSIVAPGGISISNVYSISGNESVQVSKDPDGYFKTVYKDRYGNIVRVMDHDGNITKYEYDKLQQITKVTDAKGNETLSKYDMLGRRVEIDNPDTGKTRYVYDLAGNLTAKISANLDAKGQSIRYRYTYNRLDSIDYPVSDDVYYKYGEPGAAYNRAGRMYETSKGNYKQTLFFGRMGELEKEVKTLRLTKPEVSLSTFTTKYVWDNLGRMQQMVMPNGETVVYNYDLGGMLKGCYGVKDGNVSSYINYIMYDEFGQRTKIAYGNGTVSEYKYDSITKRLENLKTYNGDKVYQNITYEFTDAGDITKRENKDFVTIDDEEKTSVQNYTYDNLHRLEKSDGSYSKESWMPFFSKRVNTYDTEFKYDITGNITNKMQSNSADYEDGKGKIVLPKTTYQFDYKYEGKQPHAVTSLVDNKLEGEEKGNWLYSYDANGNMIHSENAKEPAYRDLYWDEENRLTKVEDFGNVTTFEYDPSGERTIKKSVSGEVAYVSPNYTVRNGKVRGIHIFAGNNRLVSKLEIAGDDKQETGIYYYHPDHLGSSSVVTDRNGKFYEHMEYFPYGETWINDRSTNENLPYKFTGAEKDTETGLYYHGHRYRDARLSVWLSPDPAISTGEYFPLPPVDGDAKQYNDNLPGVGGVFNPINMNAYHYAAQNPLRFVDPDGREDILFFEVQNPTNDVFESTALIYDDNTFTDENVEQINNLVNPTIDDITAILGDPLATYTNFSTLSDDPASYGTAQEGVLYDYEQQAMSWTSASFLLSSNLGSGIIPQDPDYNDGINPSTQTAANPTGLNYLTGVYMHPAKTGNAASPTYLKGSHGCLTRQGFTEVYNYLMNSATGSEGRVLIKRN
ncbi:MAG: hypothetical protein JW982_09125 [Spirochaetes bacterium]|nr:hypothetical protein [Spirochaetota bacterium]